jgi:major capsid protein
VNLQEAMRTWQSDAAWHDARGLRFSSGMEPRAYTSEDADRGVPFAMAFDALPTLSTESNSGIPVMFATLIDPTVIDILFAPIKVAEALGGEVQRGSWTDVTAMFPVVEMTGEVSSYDDYGSSGISGVNMNWPQREAYLFQTNVGYGELEIERAALAKINIVAQKDKAAASNLARFANFAYAFGIQGLQNYGTTNDPNLSASLLPAPKAYGGTAWISGGVVRATPNEILTDIQSVITQLITQGDGNIDTQTPMTAVFPAVIDNAMTATNSFNVNVSDLLKKNYPQLKLVSGVQQYGVRSATNSQGLLGGNLFQLIATRVSGQEAGFCAYNEKMRSHPIVREMSAFRQKKTSGVWGAVIRMPFCVASMLGV